jgi:hypothetical protein
MAEAGTIPNVSETWQAVTFQQAYSTPPVVFALTGEANAFGSMVRIKNVTTTGFQVSQKEAPNLANADPLASHGITTPDTVPYGAISPGVHYVGGMTLDVGSVSTAAFRAKSGGGYSWQTINYSDFGTAPTLVLRIQTTNNATQPGNQEDPTLPLLATTVNAGPLGGSSAQIALERAEVGGAGSGSIVSPETIDASPSRPTRRGALLPATAAWTS